MESLGRQSEEEPANQSKSRSDGLLVVGDRKAMSLLSFHRITTRVSSIVPLAMVEATRRP